MRTPGQELCDTLISIQMRVKVLEELLESLKNGLRTQEDFDSRFSSNAFAVTRQMSTLKPLTDRLFLEGASAFAYVDNSVYEKEKERLAELVKAMKISYTNYIDVNKSTVSINS